MAISKSKKPIPEIQKMNSKYTIIQLETQEIKTNPQSQQQWTKAIPGLEARQRKMPMTTNRVDKSTMDHPLSKRQNKPMGKRSRFLIPEEAEKVAVVELQSQRLGEIPKAKRDWDFIEGKAVVKKENCV